MQRNSIERDAMLDNRRIEQRNRVSGFTPMLKKPRNWMRQVKYDPAQEKMDAPYHLLIAKERRLRRVAR